MEKVLMTPSHIRPGCHYAFDNEGEHSIMYDFGDFCYSSPIWKELLSFRIHRAMITVYYTPVKK